MKSTQCGVSEWALVRAIAHTGIRGLSVFYVLPTDTVKNRYVQNRVDMSVKLTPFYKELLSIGGPDSPDSTLLKHFGRGALAFAGSNTPNPFTEFPADDLIIDEFDRCNAAHVHMAEERLSASEFRGKVYISQPTTEGHGIALLMERTTKSNWFIPHDCGHWVQPDFFTHVVQREGDKSWVIVDPEYKRNGDKDIQLICDKCHKPVNRYADGEWVDSIKSDMKGRYISKLFSSAVTLKEMVDNFNDGLVNDAKMQRFYNGDLGLPYTAAGSKIDTNMLRACVDPNHVLGQADIGPCVMGVDVGSMMHVRINRLLPNDRVLAVYIGSVRSERDIVELWKRYNVKAGVIDAMPETRMSKRLAFRLRTMFMCRYGNSLIEHIDAGNKVMNVDRTSQMDSVKEMVITQRLVLPKNVLTIPEYAAQMCAPTRVYDEEKDRYFWTEGSLADHFFHAELYAMLARRFLVMMSRRGR